MQILLYFCEKFEQQMTHISKNQVKFVRSLGQKKQRDLEGLFLSEGEKCTLEMLKRFEPLMIISKEQIAALAGSEAELLEATETEIEQMSQLRTPQGVIGVFRRPKSMALPSAEDQLLLALDGVQDPGNLGTIIRTADWFGITDIVCSRDTADCWNPKVVQATMGALARVRVHYTNLFDFIGENRGCSSASMRCAVPVYGTLLDGRNMYEESAIPQKRNGIIVMGNEGNGISAEVRSLITHPLYIPSYPADRETSESLNVAIATAVVLSEFRR